MVGSMGLRLGERELERCRKKIINFISSEVESAKASGAVVALSGGIDSSLVAKLAGEALGNRLYALLMPEKGVSDPKDLEDSVKLAKELGIGYEVIEINNVMHAFEKKIPKIKHGSRAEKVAWGNVKPRVRMIFNYLAANLGNKLVLGTGNKTELLLGYFTKYGDGGCDLLPIGELYKTQARQLALYVGIDKKIIEKVPSAGLWKGQADEQELGAVYEEIDKILYSLVEEKLKPRQAAKKLGIQIKLVHRLKERMEKNRHKLRIPKIATL
ncbi:MAG: NAD+ synthase [Candidatus Hydrothermarchaeota archaeon]|nr:NAD+ synthase [Candidatus Hydrothermarchaeota archaeon]